MSELVEKVARAIDPSAWENWDNWVRMKGYTPEEAAEEFARSRTLHASLSRAESAIEAMREPTEAMVQSGCVWFRQYDPDFDPLSDNINNAWQAMIDAALNPTQS